MRLCACAQMERRERLRKLMAQREAIGELEGMAPVGAIIVEEAALQTEVRCMGSRGGGRACRW